MITLQQIFDAAWQAFIIEDNPPSMATGPHSAGTDPLSCAYSDGKGGHCAIGLVLPEDVCSAFEDTTFSVIVKDSATDLFDSSVYDMTDIKLDNFQQKLHDHLCESAGGVPTWSVSKEQRRAAYVNVASEYELTVP